MAQVLISGDELEVALSRVEVLEAAHRSLKFPLSSVSEVEVVDNPLDYLQGLKLIGTGLPDTKLGTWVSPDGRTFAADHHGSRGLVIRLEGQVYRELLVGVDDPEGAAAQIQAAQGGRGA